MNIKPIVSTFLIAVMLVAQGCKLFKKSEKETTEEYYEEVVLDENVLGEDEIIQEPEYQPSAKRVNDLLHTKLEISFNYEKQHVYGKATLTFKPYFYTTNTLVLDAKGFDIHTIRLNNKFGDTLAYTYDGKEIRIQLNKTYTRTQQYIVYLDYTAKPNEIKAEEENGHGHAITEDKGLYFINPTGEDSTKPIQIWTQGEVQSSSCWFPTIDEPNEKATQEIFVTVDPQYKTLSNGELVYSRNTNSGMRTDYWRQNLPHSPYLVMLTVGDFAVIKDKWKDIEVNYYVEKEYAPYAKQIFGNTPEMLEFYSNILGVSYPWDKYSQIVVRDYVSGAMENTGAVIFGEFVQQTSRELLDETHEEIIAHELFHHWFGDLVTCESWANLPLNESFATYGEYLWIDHKYGRMEADRHLHVNLRTYLMSSEYGGEKNLIRYHYDKPISMFDAHSYQKGGRVLHMLRNYVGDEAFFMALNLYLERFKFKNAEIHDLRLIFEEVTGEDLNWFFNQWFLGSGHPVLDIVHNYNAETGEYTLRVDQSGSNYFRLPVKVALYVKGKETINEIEVLPQAHNEFTFAVAAKPDWVSFDADKILICEKTEVKEDAQWIYQFNNSKLFLDKLEALNKLPDFAENRKETAKVVVYSALNDPFWGIRLRAIGLMDEIDFLTAEENINCIDKLKELALKDPKATVREDAVLTLGKKENPAYKNIFKAAVGDSSYDVMSAGIREFAKVDEKEAVTVAEQFLQTGSMREKAIVIGVLARYGKGNYLNQFDTLLAHTSPAKSISLLFDFSIYLKEASPIVKSKGVDILRKHYNAGTKAGFMGVIYSSVFRAIKEKTQEEINVIDEQLQVATVDTEISELSNTRAMLQEVLDKCNDMLMEE